MNPNTPEGVTQQLVTTQDANTLIIEMGAEGFARRVCQTVELNFGPDLYYPRGGTPRPDDRVAIWGTGPSKVVAALGGRLETPAYTYDEQNNRRPGLRIIEDDAGNIIRTECDAVCIVRSPITGEFVVGYATATESVRDYRDKQLQKMAKGNKDDAAPVQFIVESQVAEHTSKGRLVSPYGPGVWLSADLNAAGVREALVKARDFADRKILAGRIRTKAMRLAFLSNAVCGPYATFDYGALDHSQQRPPFARLQLYSWVQYESRQAIQSQMDALLKAAGADDSPMPLLDAEHDLSGAIDAEFEEATQAQPEPMARAVKPEPQRQQRDTQPVQRDAQPEPKQATPSGPVDDGWDRLLIELDDWEGVAGSTSIEIVRADCGIDLELPLDKFPEHLSPEQGQKYLDALSKEVG